MGSSMALLILQLSLFKSLIDVINSLILIISLIFLHALFLIPPW